MKVSKQYIKEIKNKFGGYNATWLPGVPLNVGDIGIFDKDGGFDRKANLQHLNISFQILPDSTCDELEYTSRGGVSISPKLSGKSLLNSSFGINDAGLVVEFSKQNAVVFKAKDVTYPSIANQIQLEKDIMKLYAQGEWKKEWCVVTELAVAESVTIIISKSSNSKIELKANANINAAKIDIADASFDFSILSEGEMSTKIIAAQGLTPLFKAQKMNFKGKAAKVKTQSTANALADHNAAEEMGLANFVFLGEEERLLG